MLVVLTVMIYIVDHGKHWIAEDALQAVLRCSVLVPFDYLLTRFMSTASAAASTRSDRPSDRQLIPQCGLERAVRAVGLRTERVEGRREEAARSGRDDDVEDLGVVETETRGAGRCPPASRFAVARHLLRARSITARRRPRRVRSPMVDGDRSHRLAVVELIGAGPCRAPARSSSNRARGAAARVASS